MALTLSYDSHSEIGLVRSNNQDSAYTSPRMLMVADGMGGAAAGDLASAVATWELRATDESLAELVAAARSERLAAEAASPQPDPDEDHPGDLVDVLTVLASTLAHANEKLVQLVEDDPELAGMGTTVCGFVLADDKLAAVNIGDSRAYLIRDGRLHRVTRDHSWVQTLVDEGRITEAEALEHPHRSLVLRVLNGSPQYEPDLGWLDIKAGDRLLVCSDGLCGLMTDAAIAEVATAGLSRADTTDQLVALAYQAGGYDNITLIVADVEVDGPPGVVAMIGAATTASMPTGPERTASFAALSTTEMDELQAQERAMTEAEAARYALRGRRRPSARVKLAIGALIPILALVGGGLGFYQYTQTRFFIGPDDAHVALYRGIPDRLLGQDLSTLLETDATRIADLPPYYAERVRATITVNDHETGRSTLAELRVKAEQCIAQREARARATAEPIPPASPAPDDPGTNGETAGPAQTPGGGESVGPSVPAVPVSAPEEC